MTNRFCWTLLASALLAQVAAADAPPDGKLPADATPLAYALALKSIRAPTASAVRCAYA